MRDLLGRSRRLRCSQSADAGQLELILEWFFEHRKSRDLYSLLKDPHTPSPHTAYPL